MWTLRKYEEEVILLLAILKNLGFPVNNNERTQKKLEDVLKQLPEITNNDQMSSPVLTKSMDPIDNSRIQENTPKNSSQHTPTKKTNGTKKPAKEPTPKKTSSGKKRKHNDFEISHSQDVLDFGKSVPKISTIRHPIAQKKRKIYRDPQNIKW